MQDLPRLPSRAALLVLTDRDLPTTDDLPPPDFVFQDKVTFYTVPSLQRALRGTGHPALRNAEPDRRWRGG